MTAAIHVEYSNIVLGGALFDNGMPDFADTLNESEIQAIRGFLVTQANQLRDWQQSRREIEADREAREESAAATRG